MIRRNLSEILSTGEVHDAGLNAMSITIGEVAMSSDLKVATVHVMPLLGGASVEAAIAGLARHSAFLRKRVASLMTLRYAPELRFRPDQVRRTMLASPLRWSSPEYSRFNPPVGTENLI